MKKKLLLWLVMSVALIVTGCRSDDGTNFSFSVNNKCDQNDFVPEMDKNGSFYFPEEIIQYKATGNGILLLKHLNALFSCEAKITVNTTIEDNTISIVEHGSNDTNCICPYDITMNIAPLNIGKYNVVVYYEEKELARFSIDYNTSLEGNCFIKR